MKKKEWLFIGGILIFAFLLWGGISFFKKDSYGYVRITVDGEEYGRYSLTEDQTIQINDTNVCAIKDGKVRMISASCPDHLCMKQKAVDKDGGTIVCLPNKVVIEAETSGNGKTQNGISIDAVT